MKCQVVDGVIAAPCADLSEVVGIRGAVKPSNQFELRLVSHEGVTFASYLLLRRKWIVFHCPCCGEKIGSAQDARFGQGLSSTWSQAVRRGSWPPKAAQVES